jgi:retron-type reverse transcriptase
VQIKRDQLLIPAAIKAAQKYVQEGKEWVVDIDISKFFDHVNHDILMAKIGAVIRDKPRLIACLRSRWHQRLAEMSSPCRQPQAATPA